MKKLAPSILRLLALPLCLLCLLTSAVEAQTTTPSTSGSVPARLRLDSLEGLAGKASETVDITLDGAALRLATQAGTSNDVLKNLPPGIDPALVRDLLGSLQGVYVKVYQFNQPGAYTEANVEPVLSQLRGSGSGWSSLFALNESGANGNKVNVFAANDPARDDRLNGIALVVRESKQLIIGYVVGSIDANTVAKMMQIFQSMNAPKNQSAKPAQAQPAPKTTP